MIKQLEMCEYSAHTDFSLNWYVLLIFHSRLPPSLTSCILDIVDIFWDAAYLTS